MPDTLLDRLYYELGLKTDPLEEGARRSETVLKRLDNAFKGLAGLGIATFGIGVLGKKLFDTGAIFVNAATDMEKLIRALEAGSGSAAQAADEFADLREAARLPGLGLREVTEAVVNLKAVDFTAKEATETVTQFGNALALVGRGKNELDGVILALTQMQAKGKVFAEEINQIAERVPQIRKVMQQAFGTASSEDLQRMGISARQFVEGVTTELGKLPRIAGGAANTFENFGDVVFQLQARIGALVLPQVTGFVDKLSNAFEGLSQSLERPDERLRRITAEFGKSVNQYEALNSQIRSLQTQYNALQTQLSQTNAESDEARRLHEELNGVIGQLVELVPSLNAQWDKEKGTLKDLTVEIERNQSARQSLIRAEFVQGLRAFTEETQKQQAQLANLTQGMNAVHQLAIQVGDGFQFVTEVFGGQALLMAQIAGRTETLGKTLADLGVSIDAIPMAVRALTIVYENGARGTDALGQAENLLRGQIAQTNEAIQGQSDVFRRFVSAQGQDAIDTFNRLAAAMDSIGHGRGAGMAFERDMQALARTLSVDVDLLRQMVAAAAALQRQPIRPSAAPGEAAPKPPDPKLLLQQVRQEIARVQTELRTGGETNAAVIAQAQVAAIDKILAENHIAGADLIQTYTAVADVRLDLLDKIVEAEEDAAEKIKRAEEKRIDVLGQSQEAFVAAQREQTAQTKSEEKARQTEEQRAAIERTKLAASLRNELTQISREAETATTADALIGLQNRLKAFEAANSLYIAGSQDLATRVGAINQQLIEARFAVTSEAVQKRLEAFDREAMDTLQTTLAAEGAAKDEAVRLGQQAIEKLRTASEQNEMERARFQAQMGQMTLVEYRDFLTKRLSALYAAGKSETAAYRSLAMDIHQVNSQIAEDAQRTIEKNRQQWLNLFEVIKNAAQLFSTELGQIFDAAFDFIEIRSNTSLTGTQQFAGELQILTRLKEINRQTTDMRKFLNTNLQEINRLRAELGEAPLIEKEIPGAGITGRFEETREFIDKEIDRLSSHLSQKSLPIQTAAEKLGQALDQGLREGFLNLDFGDISENLTRALDETIFEAIIASEENLAQLKPLIQFYAEFVTKAFADGVLTAEEAGVIRTVRGQIDNMQRAANEQIQAQVQNAEQQLGIEALRPQNTPATRQGGISVAIRNITQRQADEMSMILRGNNAFAAQTAQNTQKTAMLLETFLPSLDERLAMLEGGLGGLHEANPLAAGDSARAAQIQMTRRRRSRGR